SFINEAQTIVIGGKEREVIAAGVDCEQPAIVAAQGEPALVAEPSARAQPARCERARRGQCAVRCAMECQNAVAATGVRHGVDGSKRFFGTRRALMRGSQRRDGGDSHPEHRLTLHRPTPSELPARHGLNGGRTGSSTPTATWPDDRTGDVRIDRSSRWSSRASPEFPPVRVSVRARRLAIMPGWLSITHDANIHWRD